MALPLLDSTVAGTGANSYVSLNFAADHFSPSLDAEDWEAFDAEQRTRAVVSATRSIDAELKACGAWYQKYDLVDPEQALMFPRSGDVDDSGNMEIPDDVEEATCELALHLLLKKHRPDLFDTETMHDRGVTSASAGGAAVSLGSARWSQWPRNVRRLMARYIQRSGRTLPGAVVPTGRWHEGWVAE